MQHNSTRLRREANWSRTEGSAGGFDDFGGFGQAAHGSFGAPWAGGDFGGFGGATSSSAAAAPASGSWPAPAADPWGAPERTSVSPPASQPRKTVPTHALPWEPGQRPERPEDGRSAALAAAELRAQEFQQKNATMDDYRKRRFAAKPEAKPEAGTVPLPDAAAPAADASGSPEEIEEQEAILASLQQQRSPSGGFPAIRSDSGSLGSQSQAQTDSQTVILIRTHTHTAHTHTLTRAHTDADSRRSTLDTD